jgi:hypothetical protein
MTKLSDVLDAMRNGGAVLHFSLIKSRLVRTPIWELYQNGGITTINSRQVRALIKHGAIVSAGDSLFADIVPAQTWRANKDAAENVRPVLPAKGSLRWKDCDESHCSARASLVVGGTYIVAWDDTHYSGKYCSGETVRNFSVFYQPTKQHEQNDVSWLLLRSLEDAKALAQLDHDKRKGLILHYGDKRNIPAEAWKQFHGELEDWQLENNRRRIAAEVAARKKST